LRYFFIIFLLCLTIGCIPHSDNPLTDPDKEKIDLSILGTWFWKDDNESGYIHIGLAKESKLFRLIVLEFGKDGKMEVLEFSGHSSLLNGNKYLNVKRVPPADEITGYMFLKYIVTETRLGISVMDNIMVEKAIKAGSLKGKVKKGKWFSSVHITEGQKKLQEFILQNDKELFKEMKYLPRLKLPNKRSEQTP